MIKTMLRALILLSPVFMYSNSYAQSFETNSVESVHNSENSKAMNYAVFSIFKNYRAGGQGRSISKISQTKIANYDFTNAIIGSINRDNIGIIGDNYQRLIMKINQV